MEEAIGRARCSTGIEGLDGITGGGLPRGRTTLVTGAREFGEPAIFVAFEESAPRLEAYAKEAPKGGRQSADVLRAASCGGL